MKRLEYDERTGDFNEIEYSLWGVVAKILLFSLLLIVASGGVYAWFKGWQSTDAFPLIKKYCGLVYSKGLVAVKFLQSYLTVKSIVFVGIVTAAYCCRKKIWKIIKCLLYFLFWPVIKLFLGVRSAWRERDWGMLSLLVMLGVVLYWAYMFVFALISVMVGSVHIDDPLNSSMPLVFVISGAVAFIYFYAKALTMVKCGQLVVYSDWSDFLKSTAWLYALPVGLIFALDSSADMMHQIFGWCFIVGGIVSFICLVRGAFRYNSGGLVYLSLFARFAVSFLAIAALAELHSKFDKFRKGELGIIRGVLMPILIFAFVFKTFIRPMIGTYCHD